MIRSEAAMTIQVPTTIPSQQSSGSKLAIILGIAIAVGAFFYFDLGRFLSLNALQ